MCKRNNDALFFTCSLIEQLGRSLHMRRGKVAAELGEAGIQTLYRNADILHCEPIEKVADDVITEFSLQGGDFDNLAEARYTVPDVWTMGKVYARLIEDAHQIVDIIVSLQQTLFFVGRNFEKFLLSCGCQGDGLPFQIDTDGGRRS